MSTRAGGNRFRYIAVEGPIGVGKTTLARRLADRFDAQLLLECAAQNPFLPKFYAEPRAYAFAAQLFFLMQRAEQVARLRQSDLFGATRVADFMVHKDRLFAELTLDADELDLYARVHAQVIGQAPAPDLMIYLQAPVDVLLDRIAMRDIAYERSITADYLDRLTAAYACYFQRYDEGPLLVVDAAHIDLVHRDEDYNQLLAQMDHVGYGRHYLGPNGI